MTEIQLTDEQRHVLLQERGTPIDVVDPATHQRYVLLLREQYERVRPFLEQGNGVEKPAAGSEIAPGILRSQQTFWRDLPELLRDKRNRGRWVAYHGEERIGIAATEIELIRECVRRGLRDDEFDLDVIEPHNRPPWEPEVVERGGHEVEDAGDRDQFDPIGEDR